MPEPNSKYWPSARHFTEAIQCPSVCFSNNLLRETLPAVDRLGMPLVTSGQFAYVYKLKSTSEANDFAVRCFRGYLGDRDQRYRAIQNHIQTHPASFLSGFTYAPEGILVGGNRYPILFMKWIEGPTLDIYLSEMIGRREVLLHLAGEWVKLISALRGAGIAHGDLQHGNIIVEHGSLRLVDHDGMFVPEMAGWTSSEVGHQHYQHPRRDAQLFDSTLDNFSSIVIYLSLLALAERPGLWSEHHDENLLFTKTDFLDPASSTLFAKIKGLGTEQSKLVHVLEEAARGEPAAVPSLLDIVRVKSALPSWMTAPPDLESRTRTREVIQTEPVVPAGVGQWKPWQAKPLSSSVPATPASSTVQTLFGGPAPPSPGWALAKISDPTQVWRNTPVFAKEILGKTFLWWYWGTYIFLKGFGLGFFSSLALALFAFAVICLTYGFIRAQEVARKSLQAGAAPTKSAFSTAAQSPPLPLRKSVAYPLQPSSITVSDQIVANQVLSIYHVQDCAWVEQISDKNRVSFSSPSEASSAGYKPCRVCSPLI